MLYLFNKVHLKPDVLFDKRYDRIIVSPSVPVAASNEFRGLVDEVFGPIHFHTSSYDELIQEHFEGNETNFIQWLVDFDNSKRLEIHVQGSDLLTVAIKWYKALFVNITPDEAYNVFKLIYMRFGATYGVPMHPQSLLKSRDLKIFRSVAESLPAREDFKTLWQDTVAYDITAVKPREFFAKQAPIELQIASIYADPDYAFGNDLKAKVELMIRKLHIRMAVEAKHMVLASLEVLPDFDVLTMTVSDWIQTHPDYNFLDDDKFLPDYHEYIYATYDLTVVRNACVDIFTRLGYENVDAVFQTMHTLEPNVTFEQIMGVELAHLFGRQQLGWWEYHNFINVYLLDYVLNLIRAGDLVTLQSLAT